jgi:hypothetical protein
MDADPLFSRMDIRYFTPSHSSVPVILAGDSLYTLSVVNHKMTASLYAVLPFSIPDITSIAVNAASRIVYCGSTTHGLYVFKEPDFYTYALSREFIEERSKQRPDPFGYNNIYSVLTFNAGQYAVTNEEYIFDLPSGKVREIQTLGASNMHRLFNYPQSQNSCKYT